MIIIKVVGHEELIGVLVQRTDVWLPTWVGRYQVVLALLLVTSNLLSQFPAPRTSTSSIKCKESSVI